MDEVTLKKAQLRDKEFLNVLLQDSCNLPQIESSREPLDKTSFTPYKPFVRCLFSWEVQDKKTLVQE